MKYFNLFTRNEGTVQETARNEHNVQETAQSAPVEYTWLSVAWSPDLGLFAAIADTGAGNRLLTSPDGFSWTAKSTPVDDYWKDSAWSADLVAQALSR